VLASDPAKPRMFGRESELSTLLNSLDKHSPIAIVGMGGIGKSTLAKALFHSDEAIEKFGDRRYFVRCDVPNNMVSFIQALSRTLELPPNPNKLIEPILTSLHSEPSLLVLDNLETVEIKGYIQDFKTDLLDHLEFENLVLVVTTRVNHGFPKMKNKAKWIRVPINKVDKEVAYQIFANSIDNVDVQRSDELKEVLEELDGHPLSVQLFAANISPYRSLEVACEEWKQTRVKMLKEGAGNEKDSNLAKSVQLSLNSPRLCGNHGSESAYLLATLPDGMLVEDADNFFKDFGKSREAVLECGLAYEEVSCLRQLVPIKETIVGMMEEKRDTLRRCHGFYLDKATELKKQYDFNIAVPSWFVSQIVNLEFIVRQFLAKGDLNSSFVLQTILNLAKFVTGLGDHLLTIEVYKTVRDSLLVRSRVQKWIPLALFLSRSKVDMDNLIHFLLDSAHVLLAFDLDLALEMTMKGSELCKGSDRAHFSRTAGNISSSRGNFELAISHYEEAIKVFHSVKEYENESITLHDVYRVQAKHLKDFSSGQKTALRGLSLAEGRNLKASQLVKWEYNLAITHINHSEFDEAKKLAKKIQSRQIEIERSYGLLAQIEFRRKNFSEAVKLYNQQLEILTAKNIVAIVAFCHRDLGRAFFEMGNYEEFSRNFRLAIQFFQRFGTQYQSDIDECNDYLRKIELCK
jgi:tetratricopeptide (TPR) repeat protein